MSLLLALFAALFISTITVPLAMRYAHVLGLVDEPDGQRKVHTAAIPRCGGLGIVAGFFFGSLYFLPLQADVIGVMVGAGIIVLSGIIDDRVELSPKLKLVGQVLAAAAAMLGGCVMERLPFFGLDPMPLWVTVPITLFFIVGVINAVNLSDGLDGLAAGNSLLSLLLLTVLAIDIERLELAILALASIGGLIGFLRFNTHPATVFMGDTGSQFLGYMTVTLALLCTQSETSPFSAALPLLIIGLPILDTLTVMFIRWSNGRSLFAADRNHIHHQLLALNMRQYEVVAILYILCTILAILAYTLRFSADASIFLTFGIFGSLVLTLLRFAQRHQWVLRNDAILPQERRAHWTRRISWYYHNGWKLLLSLIGLFTLSAPIFLRGNDYIALPMACGVVLFLVSLRVFTPLGSVTNARLSIGIALALYLLTCHAAYEAGMQATLWIDIFLVVLFLLMLLTHRMTRKLQFRFDTHDYLTLLVSLVLPIYLGNQFDIEHFSRLTLRFVVLFYTCEIILARDTRSAPWLERCGWLSILLFGLATIL